MGVRFPSQGSTAIVTTPVVGPSEQIVCTTGPISQSIDGQLFLILWEVVFTPNATGPVLAYNIRRGTTVAGTRINIGGSVTEVATVGIARSGWYIDAPGVVAQVQYSLSINVTNASTLTINETALIVIAL